MNTIGKKIRLLREQNNIKQKDLANICHVVPSTIAQYESDSIQPSQEVKNILCDYFNVTLDFLSGNTDYPYKKTYSLKEEDFVHVPVVSLPELNMPMSSVLVPIEKVLNGDYLYLHSPCEFYDARINKGDLLFIQKTRSAEDGDIVIFRYDNQFFIGKYISVKSYSVIYNSIFSNGFLSSENSNFELIGIILEVTFNTK